MDSEHLITLDIASNSLVPLGNYKQITTLKWTVPLANYQQLITLNIASNLLDWNTQCP